MRRSLTSRLFQGIGVLLLVLASGTSFSCGAERLLAGAAKVDISPRELPALHNGGFLQRSSDRIIDPLHARALVIADDKETIAIVIVDSCMLPTQLCDQIKRIANRETGIAVDRILISATHTHSAPSAMSMCLGCDVDKAYEAFLPGKVAEAIVDAHQLLQPAKIGWSIVDGSDFTHCRRWITRSDAMGNDPFGAKTVRAMMHPGYQNPNYTSPAGPIDPWLSVLSVVAETDETPICLMANLSMHYFGGGAFSADYFGEVARALETAVSASAGSQDAFVGIMSQGTSGDLHWMDYSKPRQSTRRQQYSASVANRILQASQSIEYRSDLSLAMDEVRLTMDRRVPEKGRLQWARPINAARLGQPPKNREEVYAQQAEWIHQNPKAEVVLQAIRIGDLGITAIPNEVYGITGLKLKRQSPLAATFNLELANGATGYIPPPEQHRLGGYTTWPARTAGLSEQAEPEIVESLLRLLESVSQRERRPIEPSQSAYSEAVANEKPIAYWRLDEMSSDVVVDSLGNHPAEYVGGVALFLPGADGAGFATADYRAKREYGNRSVYLAGGHIRANLNRDLNEYTVVTCFANSLPEDARDNTGVVLSSETESLSIAGRAAADQAGVLMLRVGQDTFFGSSRLATSQWHHVALVREQNTIRVFLDGREEPEINASTKVSQPVRQFLIGDDGRSLPSFDGRVDECALFDRALDPNKITDLYQASGLTPPPQPKQSIVLGSKPTTDAARKHYGDTVVDSKPVAYWRLHDASKESAADFMGDHSARYEPGAAPLNSSPTIANFSGGRVAAAYPDLGNTYSVELWLRNQLPFDARPVTAYLFSRSIDGVHGSPGDNLGIGGTHSDGGQLIVFNGNERNQLVAGRTRLKPGSWSHVIFVRRDQRVTVYLNGDPEPEIDAELPIAYPDGCDTLFLGGRGDNFANLQGMLEEVSLYDRVLTRQEVRSHFQAAGAEKVVETTVEPASKPAPTSPDAAVQSIHVPDGFEVQLVAAEPLVKDPVAIDWGPDGKLWVVEMADYPLGIDGEGKPGGRVRFLFDTDDDGRYDESNLFAEGLRFPTGVMAWGRGVLVTAAPEILYLEDSTGDGKADVRRTLYSGFLEGNQQLRVNGLRWGLDNWIYCASGSHHAGYGKDSQILVHQNKTKHPIGSRDFRIRPGWDAIDPQSGPSQYGRTRDDWGNWFGVQNSHPLWHYVLSDHHIRRNPHFAPPNPKHQIVTPTNPKVYPASTLQKRYHNFSQSGRFTSACSPMIYRDEVLFPRGDEQHAFTCEPFHNLVQHNLIVDAGVSFRFRRDPAEKDLDFFASEDRWCRPVMARTGPDGALWVVDMYRYMIEHPQWLPQNGKDELRPWYRSGQQHGRIYRVVRHGQTHRRIPRLAALSPDELVAALESPNGWQRDLAQRMLVTQSLTEATRSLEALVRDSPKPLARLHALFTLDGMLGGLTAPSTEVMQLGLADDHPGVRRGAVRIAAESKVDVNLLASMVNDPDTKVRLELASTLGEYDAPEASIALAALLSRNADEPYLIAAVMSSLNQSNVVDVLANVLASGDSLGQPHVLELVGQAVALSERDDLGRVVSLVRQPSGERLSHDALLALPRVLDGLNTRGLSTSVLAPDAAAQIAKSIQRARRIASDETADADLRAAAIALLGREEGYLDVDVRQMKALLVPQSPSAVQNAVVSRLAARREPMIADILLAGWRSHSPELRRRITEIVVTRDAWSESLRERLETESIRVSELSAPIRQRLTEKGKGDARWRKVLSPKGTASRAEVVKRYDDALTLAGDLRRGEKLFRKLCINCHKLRDEGHEVGPQLASITDKSKRSLFASILDPNAAVDARYFNYSVLTQDGRVLTGRLETETASSITLLAAEGKRAIVLRRDIEELTAPGGSVMPEGLEQGITPQDLADVIHFVRETFR